MVYLSWVLTGWCCLKHLCKRVNVLRLVDVKRKRMFVALCLWFLCSVCHFGVVEFSCIFTAWSLRPRYTLLFRQFIKTYPRRRWAKRSSCWYDLSSTYSIKCFDILRSSFLTFTSSNLLTKLPITLLKPRRWPEYFSIVVCIFLWS